MVGENRWDEKAGLRRDAVRSRSYPRGLNTKKQVTGNEKVSTAAAQATKKFSSSETDDRAGSGRSFELVLRVG